MRYVLLVALSLVAVPSPAQQPPAEKLDNTGLAPRTEVPEGSVLLPRGTRVPLALIKA